MRMETSPGRLAARLCEEIPFTGHLQVTATHETTIEITKEPHLTPRGDCIIGVGAPKSASQLSAPIKRALASDTTRVRFTIVAPGGEFSFWARGDKRLSFESSKDMVIRKSDFVCGRTVAVRAGSSARDIPRELVRSLRSREAAGVLRMEVEP